MDCVDGTTYHCRVNYKPTIGETTQANVTATLSVTGILTSLFINQDTFILSLGRDNMILMGILPVV